MVDVSDNRDVPDVVALAVLHECPRGSAGDKHAAAARKK
jgi:hypothetical protein